MLTRRRVAFGAAALAASPVANAAGRCSGYDYRGVQWCEVGLNIGRVRTAQQDCENWCWAACIEAAFAFYGAYVSQEAIVSKIFGRLQCLPANGPMIVGALSGAWRDDRGNRFYAGADVLTDIEFGYARPDALRVVHDSLAYDQPLICGALGHATLLTAMQYERHIRGGTQLMGLTVRDPWPGTPNRRQLTANEVYGTSFLCRVVVS